MSAAAQIVFGIFIGNPYSEMIYFVVDSATKIAAYLVVLVLTAQLRALYERAQNSTRFDALTHALSRAAFSEALNEKVARQTWSKSPISLAWIDCDEFKAFNEAFGHGAGDQVLCTIVDTAKLVLRRTAVIARLGGHEFGVLLPGLDGESAAEAMRTLRNRLMWAMANHGWDIRFNIGLITFLDAPGSTTEAISACRSLMQEAKRTGKDRFEQRQYSAAA
jgi:diguanylate cyclase (GGDEF)-like protein